MNHRIFFYVNVTKTGSDGVLRKAIETELKTKYKNYYYQDASFREYGYGATMVTIK